MIRYVLPLVILLPLVGGAILPLLRLKEKKRLHAYVLAVLLAEAAAVTALLAAPAGTELRLFAMSETLVLALRMDGISKLFLAVAAYGFLVTAVYGFRYLAHGEREDSFYVWFLLSLGGLAGMDLARNLITMYLFFEMITLLSMPLVLHDRTRESIRAALKYLFYSVAGAFLGLAAIFFLARYSTTLDFNPGGNLDPAMRAGHETLLRVVIFLGVIGFGAKAGLYPLHGWLPTAHPVAPAPASAVRFSASEKWDQGYGAYAVGETLRHAWIDVRTGEPAASVAQTALIAPGGSALTVAWQLLQTLFAVPSSSP